MPEVELKAPRGLFHGPGGSRAEKKTLLAFQLQKGNPEDAAAFRPLILPSLPE
jgi:hypothetical protein